MNLVFAIVIFLLVSSSWIIPVIRSDDPPSGDDPFIYFYPPVNSFGMGVQKSVNPVFLKNLIQSNMDWELFYKRYSTSGWANGNDYLHINLSWNNSINAFKITLTFIAPVDIYQAEFRMGFNVNVLDFIEKNDNEIWFNYSTSEGNINLLFNYSDLKSINGLYFDKGIVNNRFYFLFGRFNIPQNLEGYVFDPVLGYNKIGGGNIITQDIITGTNHTMPDTCDGEIYYGKAYMKSFFSGTPYPTVEMLVYASDKTLIAQSNAITLSGGNTPQWYNFTFASESISASATYAICVWGAGTAPRTPYIYYDTGTNNVTNRDSETYDGTPPNPWIPVLYDDTMSISAYIVYNCTEEGGCTNESFITPVSVPNGTSNVNCNVNWTALINSSCCNWNEVNISCDGQYHNTSGNNGTYWLNLTSLSCGTSYTIYVNSTGCNSTSYNRSWFTFSTLPCCDLTIENVTFDGLDMNDTYYCKDYNESFLNLSFDAMSLCNSSISWINASSSFGNSSNWTGENNGNFWVNWTNISFSCETNYTIWINGSTLNNCDSFVNYTYWWFNTCDCYTPPSECNCILSNENITNKTININNTADGYYNFTIDYNISCGNFTGAYLNITVLNMSHNVSISSNGTAYLNYTYNFSCNQNITWYVNLTGPNCNNFSTYWFRTVSCGAFPCNCSDFYTKDEIDVMLLLYVKKSDMMDLAIANSQLSILLTLVLFGFFFYVGYNTNRKSGGAFVMFSGFIFIGLSLLIGSYLNAIYVTPLLLPFAGFIILIGVKKWLYEDSNKTEG